MAVDLDRAGYEVLDRVACLGLLALGGVGRVGVSIGALPAILPVHFFLDGDYVLFSTAYDSALAKATHGAVVAFETDGLDDDHRHWSVALTGVARHRPPAEPAAGSILVALGLDRLTGRRAWPGPAPMAQD